MLPELEVVNTSDACPICPAPRELPATVNATRGLPFGEPQCVTGGLPRAVTGSPVELVRLSSTTNIGVAIAADPVFVTVMV